MTQFLLDDPGLVQRGPGEELAIAVARAGGGDAAISVTVPLTTRFPLAATRPRPPVRDQLKVATVTEDTLRYVQEVRDDRHDRTSGTRYAGTPEAHFGPRVAKATLTDLTVSVPVPDEICTDPALLARFVDHRVIVRMCTLENEVLLHGSPDGAITGLLGLPGLRRLTGTAGTELHALTDAAGEVEEMGGSCDGLVMHPAVYWRLVADRALPLLDAAGLRLTRTRMIGRRQVLLGDFRAGVTLLDGGVSTLALRRAGRTALIEAGMRIGLAVQLPQHFVLLELAGNG